MADFVFDLPEGIHSECGERGSNLSHGQAQRIAIARGLLRPGGILLLDEISASLDEQTEHELYRRLFEAFPAKTVAPVHGDILQLRIFVDRCSIEAFDAEGKMAMTNLVFPSEPYNSIKVKGGKATVYEIKY